MNKPEQFYWLSMFVTVLALSLFWVGFDCQWGILYAPFPYHRLQVEALLDGRLSLSSSIEQIDQGLTWYNGQVNQVWGLGVALWMVPFEVAWRSFGASPCPDRIPLLAAYTLFVWYASRGGLAVAKALRSKGTGVAFFYLVVLFPPLWNLILGWQSIFEETILYACLNSVALLVGVVRFLLLQKRSDFWIVCVLSGLSGLVRVTHAIYGAIAGLLCAFVMLRAAIHADRILNRRCDWRKIGELLLGCSVILVGFGFLAWSNTTRFGSATECGHRLTNHAADVVYLTRFGNPFADTSMLDAAKELVSWIFLSPFHRYGSDWEHLLPWQASTTRWRGIDKPSFDPSYLLITLFSFVAGVTFLYRCARPHGWSPLHPHKPLQRTIEGMLVWCIGSSLSLCTFYLYAPILTTRYILDFAPSLAASCILVLLLPFHRLSRIVPALLLVWLCCESVAIGLHHATANVRVGLSRENLPRLPAPNGEKLTNFKGRYSVDKHPVETNIKNNGQGWSINGMASPIVLLAVDRPRFLEISVGETKSSKEGSTECFRAKIGNLELPITSVVPAKVSSNGLVIVRFRIPERIRDQNLDQLIFVSFTTDWERNARESQRPLVEVRWR